MDALPQFEQLPPLYAPWVDALLGAPIPAERAATCNDCAMCDPGAALPERRLEFFDPRGKCCTYMPRMWNFLAGAVLADDDPAMAPGRVSIERRIDAGLAVTPMGLDHTTRFDLVYEQALPAWGRSLALQCPHFIEEGGGRCAVWRHRESTCATWFCKHVRGAVGREFWVRLHTLLALVERELARWCVIELDIGAEAMAALFPPLERRRAPVVDADALDGTVNVAAQRRVWGRWFGRERELYRAAAALVAPLGWDDVVGHCGSEVTIQARLTRDAFQHLTTTDVPEGLHVARFEAAPSSDGSVVVTGYSSFDGLRLPPGLVGALRHFDGRPTADAIAAIEREDGMRVTPALVRKLADFRVLVGA